MFLFFRRKARIAQERKERVLETAERRAAQVVLNKRAQQLIAAQRSAAGGVAGAKS